MIATSSITLPDGRRLAFSELGDPLGTPVIHQHGMPGSRLEQQAEDSLFRSFGVRVITPDRPGYGLSDPNPGARLADWPRDVAALADALRLDSFRVTALSGGGIYALACAALIPERLTRVVVCGCPAPMSMPGALEGMRWMTRAGVWLGRHAPSLFAAAANAMSGVIRRYPGFFVDGSNRDKPASDLRWMAMSNVRKGAEAMLRESFRSGGLGYTRDIRNLALPWELRLDDVSVAVEIWHGDVDTVIPSRHGVYLAAAIPRATLHLCAGEGHMVFWSHIEEVFGASRVAAAA